MIQAIKGSCGAGPHGLASLWTDVTRADSGRTVCCSCVPFWVCFTDNPMRALAEQHGFLMKQGVHWETSPGVTPSLTLILCPAVIFSAMHGPQPPIMESNPTFPRRYAAAVGAVVTGLAAIAALSTSGPNALYVAGATEAAALRVVRVIPRAESTSNRVPTTFVSAASAAPAASTRLRNHEGLHSAATPLQATPPDATWTLSLTALTSAFIAVFYRVRSATTHQRLAPVEVPLLATSSRKAEPSSQEPTDFVRQMRGTMAPSEPSEHQSGPRARDTGSAPCTCFAASSCCGILDDAAGRPSLVLTRRQALLAAGGAAWVFQDVLFSPPMLHADAEGEPSPLPSPTLLFPPLVSPSRAGIRRLTGGTQFPSAGSTSFMRHHRCPHPSGATTGDTALPTRRYQRDQHSQPTAYAFPYVAPSWKGGPKTHRREHHEHTW